MAIKKFSFFTTILLAVLLISCKDEYSICNETRDVLMQSAFYTQINGVEQAFTPSDFSFKVLNNPLFIHNHVGGLSAFSIPLNPAVDSTQFYIQHAASVPADTLTLVYNTYNVTLSPACGTVNFHTIIRAYSTLNSIDSISIENPAVKNLLVENIKIYY